MQQILDAQAASFQTRVKTLLTQFGDAENVAAQAIIAGLQGLDSYETNPEGAPPRPQVQDILDNETELPADPKRLHDFWETLTPAEKDALWEHDQYLGNRDGLPAIDRDHYNRLKLDDELARAVAGDPAVKDKLADLQAVQSTVGDNPGRKLMVLDSPEVRERARELAASVGATENETFADDKPGNHTVRFYSREGTEFMVGMRGVVITSGTGCRLPAALKSPPGGPPSAGSTAPQP